MKKLFAHVAWTALAVVLAVSLMSARCVEPGKSSVIVLLAADVGSKSIASGDLKKEVNVADIKSLTVTVTEIALDSGDNSDGDADDEGDGQAKAGQVVIFSGEKDVNILDLSDVSEVLSSADVEPGQYTKIRLAITNPRLVLVADPETESTDIQLTANGHLFVSQSFELPAGEESLILLSFDGIHLVETGNGKYVWTPQLRATIEVTSAEAQVKGVIQSVDVQSNTMTVIVADSQAVVTVDFTNATGAIFLPGDGDTPTGTPADLVVGSEVEVTGLLTVDGVLGAATIVILPVPAP